MTEPIGPTLDPTKHIPSGAMAMAWQWSREAIMAALEHAGRPPRLDINAMLNAAFAVDGPNLTAMVLQVVVSERIAELDAEPYIVKTDGAAGVAVNGQFFLALLTGDFSFLRAERAPVADPDQTDPLAEGV